MRKPIDDRYIPYEPDYELWIAFLAGDEEALGNVFVRYYNRLYLYGMNLTESRNEVQDAIQELFLNLWRQRVKINRAHSVEYYLLNSLRRIIFRQKKRNSSIDRLNREYAEENMSFLASIEDKIIQKEEEREQHNRTSERNIISEASARIDKPGNSIYPGSVSTKSEKLSV